MTIRLLAPADLEALVPLHRSAFGPASVLSDSVLVDHFREVFLDNPWARTRDPGSLVYLDGSGRIVGFIGVFSTQWALEGAPCPVAVTTQLMVDREAGSGLAAIQLLRAVFSGPFDLVLTDGATDAVRRLWGHLGGETLAVESLEWVRPLRPGRHLSSAVLSRAPRMSFLRPLTSLAAAVPDALLARLRPNRFDRSIDELHAAALDPVGLAALRNQMAADRRLVPRYSEEQVEWLLAQARQHGRHGDFRAVLLKDSTEVPVGWYTYYFRRGASAQVIEVGSREPQREQVLRHLFRDAWLHGAVALVGHAQARDLGTLGDLWCYFRRAGPWVLAFSRRHDIRLALHAGDAWFSRLDAEYWMRFLGDPLRAVTA